MHGAPLGSMSPSVTVKLSKHPRWTLLTVRTGSVIVASQPETVRPRMPRDLAVNTLDDALIHEA
jgi:hypothetical protein